MRCESASSAIDAGSKSAAGLAGKNPNMLPDAGDATSGGVHASTATGSGGAGGIGALSALSLAAAVARGLRRRRG